MAPRFTYFISHSNIWTSQCTEMSTSSQRWASVDKYSAKYFISCTSRSLGHWKSCFTDKNNWKTYNFPSIRKIYNFPSIRKIYNYPSIRKIYNYPSIRKIYNFPSIRKIYNFPYIRKIYNFPSIRKAYYFPSIRKMYNFPSIKKMYNFPPFWKIYRGYLLFWGEYQIYFIECFENIRIFTSAQHQWKFRCFQLTRWNIFGIYRKQVNFLFILYFLGDLRLIE